MPVGRRKKRVWHENEQRRSTMCRSAAGDSKHQLSRRLNRLFGHIDNGINCWKPRIESHVRVSFRIADALSLAGPSTNIAPAGFLTPGRKRAAFSFSPHARKQWRRKTLFKMPGHSGGAVPDFHRYSLFVGCRATNAADHQHTIARNVNKAAATCRAALTIRRSGYRFIEPDFFRTFA